MKSRVKTGDVIQIRKNGPNYIALGKVKDRNGTDFILATRNGNVTAAGMLKKTSGQRAKPKFHVIEGSKVRRVHQSRPVDLQSVLANGNRRFNSHLEKATSRNGVQTEAPNVMASIANLQASL